MNVKVRSTLLALTGLASLPLLSQNWPMLGGAPQRNMVSAMSGLPESWDVKSGKSIKWKAQIGSTSYGNPVVADGKIFLGTNNGNPRDPAIKGDRGVLMCFRESDGKFLWQAISDKLATGPQNDFPEQGVCSSPAVEGKHLYYVSNRGELVCLDTEGFLDGKNEGPFQNEVHKGPGDADIIWKLDMMKELGVYQRNMANSSPVIWEDLVFVVTSNGRSDDKVPSPKAPSFLAVNKNTGKVVWQDDSPGAGILRGQWSSPALGLVDGALQAFFPGGDGWLYGFNARTGQRLWKFDLNPKSIALEDRNYGISAPVFSDGNVIMSAGQDPDNGSGRGAAYSINPSKRGDITESGKVWHYEKINRSISTAAVANGLAFLSDIGGILHCLDAKSGTPYWTFDLKSPVWGSPLLADGKVYLGNEDGDVAVFKANSTFEKPSMIDMGDSIYSTPVPANGVLYVMTRSQLFAITANRSGSGTKQEKDGNNER
jgi:outer membrane protein assembly factor BamB